MAAAPLSAQAQDLSAGYGDLVVDVSDPSVSIDLSVLDDGGVGSLADGPLSGTLAGPRAGTYRTPGPQAPVSTLYIQPSESLTLPPQTKPLIAHTAPDAEPESDLAEDASMDAQPEAVAESMAEPEPATEPEFAPVTESEQDIAAPELPGPAEPAPTQMVETAPAPVTQDVAAPQETQAPVEAMPEAAPSEIATEPAPTPAPMAEPTPEAPPAQAEAAPQEPETQDAAAQTPPPPPQALTSAQTPAEPQAPTAPAAPTSGAVVVDLPPQLNEAMPGVASLPSPTGPLTDGDNMRIVFEHDSSKLPSDARDALKAIAERLNQQDTLRLQLLAYAGDAETSASAARRLSLSRALSVRSYLIENGVRSTRIDVRALGNKSTEGVTERVDITVVER